MGGCRHSSDATAVGNGKQNALVRGVPFFRSIQGRFEAEKGPGTQGLGVQDHMIG